MRIMKSLGLIFNAHTYLITILSIISTYLSYKLQFYADLPLTLIGIAVVFPIVFSINGAYKRREIALEHYASFKAHGRALFFAGHDWLPDTSKKFQNKVKRLLYNLLFHCRIMFNTSHKDDDYRERVIYRDFAKLSKLVEEFRDHGMSQGEISRCNQYISKMLIAFESMKHIYQYRTPVTLRAYSKIFIYILPIFYGPYFAYLARDFNIYMMFIMPILFSVILISLDNIQDQLENPFDQIGEDDINLNVEKFIDSLELDY